MIHNHTLSHIFIIISTFYLFYSLCKSHNTFLFERKLFLISYLRCSLSNKLISLNLRLSCFCFFNLLCIQISYCDSWCSLSINIWFKSCLRFGKMNSFGKWLSSTLKISSRIKTCSCLIRLKIINMLLKNTLILKIDVLYFTYIFYLVSF